ncbi:hypothetical protein, partial [Micrococcus luteus]|uniref:hypothetical protein n=1 Tax=Micrococcus luteus TaxID=1270 RepID=UPI000561CCAC
PAAIGVRNAHLWEQIHAAYERTGDVVHGLVRERSWDAGQGEVSAALTFRAEYDSPGPQSPRESRIRPT